MKTTPFIVILFFKNSQITRVFWAIIADSFLGVSLSVLDSIQKRYKFGVTNYYNAIHHTERQTTGQMNRIMNECYTLVFSHVFKLNYD